MQIVRFSSYSFVQHSGSKILFENVLWSLNSKLVKSQWIHFHGKFKLESNFQHFIESRFTLVLCREFPFTYDSHKFSSFTWNRSKINKFSIKKGEYCHSQISRFTQLVWSEITFALDSRKFLSRPIDGDFSSETHFSSDFHSRVHSDSLLKLLYSAFQIEFMKEFYALKKFNRSLGLIPKEAAVW